MLSVLECPDFAGWQSQHLVGWDVGNLGDQSLGLTITPTIDGLHDLALGALTLGNSQPPSLGLFGNHGECC